MAVRTRRRVLLGDRSSSLSPEVPTSQNGEANVRHRTRRGGGGAERQEAEALRQSGSHARGAKLIPRTGPLRGSAESGVAIGPTLDDPPRARDTMISLRPSDLAGTWYPSSAAACDRFLDTIALPHVDHVPTVCVGAIVPHAGWVYSGGVAYQALRALKERGASPDVVIAFGGHLGARERPRILLEGGWSTPFGPLPVARELAEDLSMAIECEIETPEEYADDNALEVLMPMVKKLWPNTSVVTLGVPPTALAPEVGIEALTLAERRGIANALVIGSTDLTHYGPNYNYRPQGDGRRGLEWVKTKNDPEVIREMEALDPSRVMWVAERSRNACCSGAAAACIAAARRLGARKGVTTQYTTSFDVRPSGEEPSSFVGYAGVVLGR